MVCIAFYFFDLRQDQIVKMIFSLRLVVILSELLSCRELPAMLREISHLTRCSSKLMNPSPTIAIIISCIFKVALLSLLIAAVLIRVQNIIIIKSMASLLGTSVLDKRVVSFLSLVGVANRRRIVSCKVVVVLRHATRLFHVCYSHIAEDFVCFQLHRCVSLVHCGP